MRSRGFGVPGRHPLGHTRDRRRGDGERLGLAAVAATFIAVLAGCGDASGPPAGDAAGRDAGAGSGLDASGSPAADAASPAPPRYEAFFSNPGPEGENDERLEEELAALLELAEPGSAVHAAVYTWSRGNMAEAFIAAHQRGVDVRLLIGSEFAAVETLKEALPDGHVYVCRRGGDPSGCHGGNINHNKFFLFSRLTDGSRDVVVQSSANLTNPQLGQNNNFVVIRDDLRLYHAFRQYWHDLSRDVDDLDYYVTAEGDEGTKAYFLPRASATSATGERDPVYAIFDDIDCSAGSELRIGQARWSNARRGIAHKAAELQESGCNVEVVVRDEHTGDDTAQILEDGGVELTFYPLIHSKYWLVDGVYRGERARIVWTGAMNFTGSGLRSNDEAFVQIDDDELYDAYLEDWRAMRDHPDAE